MSTRVLLIIAAAVGVGAVAIYCMDPHGYIMKGLDNVDPSGYHLVLRLQQHLREGLKSAKEVAGDNPVIFDNMPLDSADSTLTLQNAVINNSHNKRARTKPFFNG